MPDTPVPSTKDFQEALVVLQVLQFINQMSILLIEHEVISSCFISKGKVPLECQSATDLDASFEDAFTSYDDRINNDTQNTNAEGDNSALQASTLHQLHLVVSVNSDHKLNVFNEGN